MLALAVWGFVSFYSRPEQIADPTPIASSSQVVLERPAPTEAPTRSPLVNVTYQVIVAETARWSATYSNKYGDTEQSNDLVGPWKKTLVVERGRHLYISAQNGEDWGLVYVSIEVDGKQVRDSKGEGAYAIGTCSYIVPE